MSELTIDTASITEAIRKNLDSYTPDLAQSQVGRVVEVGDGIARISGLPDCPVNALLDFESGVRGLAHGALDRLFSRGFPLRRLDVRLSAGTVAVLHQGRRRLAGSRR